MVCSLCLSTLVWGDGELPEGTAVVPVQLPRCFSYLLPFFFLFPSLYWCGLVAAGLDHRQECFGVTMPFGLLRGAALGSTRGTGAGECPSV